LPKLIQVMIKTVFFGERKAGADCLSLLSQNPNFEVVAVVTCSQEPCFKKTFAGAPCYFHDKKTKDEIFAIVDALKADVLLSVDNNFIFSERFLNSVNHPCFNLHFGNLPRNAGWMSYVGAILNGDDEYGITIHRIVPKVDAGRICIQHTFPITNVDTSYSVFITSLKFVSLAYKEFLDCLVSNSITESPQNLSQRTIYTRKFFKGLYLNFDWPPEKIRRLLRAMDFGFLKSPLPRVPVFVGDQKLYLDELELSVLDRPQENNLANGTILNRSVERIDIKCSQGIVRVVKKSTGETKTPAPATDFSPVFSKVAIPG
jgi:methionyl-tRNA formyltransferase